MDKKHTQKALKMTKNLLEDFYQKKPELFFSLCSDNVTWIGAQIEQYDIGLDVVKKDILSVTKDMFCCYLRNEEFMVTQNMGNVCTIIGRYIVVSNNDEAAVVEGEQRCVAVWEKHGDELILCHLSSFSPIDVWKVGEGEHFVTKMGEMTKKFVDKKVSSILCDRTIEIVDDNRVTHFVKSSDIMWIEAMGRGCVVHTTDKEICAGMSFTRFAQCLNKDFVKVHRSYIVNIHYIKEIEPYRLTMQDAAVISIPQKKYNCVKAQLKGILSSSNI